MQMIRRTSRTLFQRIPFCGLNGGIMGIIVGLLFALLQFEQLTLELSPSELLVIILLLMLIAWAFILLLVGVWLRYGAGQIALVALVNAALTTTLTVLGNLLLKITILAVPLGWLIGVLVGTVLCWLCKRGYLPSGGLRDVR